MTTKIMQRAEISKHSKQNSKRLTLKNEIVPKIADTLAVM